MFIKPPKIIRQFYPNLIWKKEDNSKNIWLTFDDGPHPEASAWILSLLKTEKINATFFLIGQEMQKFPELVDQIKKEGHKIANHSYSHKNGWITCNKSYLEDIEKCQKLMPGNDLFRPPYGKLSFTQIHKLKKKYKLILWDIMSMDFRTSSPTKIINNVLDNIENGSIIVFHNNIKSLNNLKKSLPNIIKELKKRDYTFSTAW